MPRHTLQLSCRAILFDMDGTLVDSTPIVERAWSWWAERHHLPLDEILRFSHGRPTLSTFQHFRPGVDHAPELEEMNRFEHTELDGIVAIPGAEQAVRAATRGPWAVVTSADRQLAVARIATAGLPLPGVLVPADEISHGKPHPEGFLRAAHELGVAPRDCLVFEDTGPGIQAGLSAGMQVVGLLTTVPAAQLAHQPLIHDFRDLTITYTAPVFSVHIQTEGG